MKKPPKTFTPHQGPGGRGRTWVGLVIHGHSHLIRFNLRLPRGGGERSSLRGRCRQGSPRSHHHPGTSCCQYTRSSASTSTLGRSFQAIGGCPTDGTTSADQSIPPPFVDLCYRVAG